MARARILSFMQRNFLFLIVAVSLFSMYVFAGHSATTVAGGTQFSILEDRNQLLNVTINNSDINQSANISSVTISLPSGLVFTASTANTSANANHAFSNSSTLLNWTNTTFYLINGSAGNNPAYFWFNVSATAPGLYSPIVVTTTNGTATFNPANLTVFVNDTTNGTGFNVFPSNNTYTTSRFINISGNFTDNFNLSRVTLYVWNSSNALVNSTIVNTSAVNGTNAIANFTYNFTAEGRYFFNFLVNDTANNSAFNATNFTVVYDVTQPLLEYNDSGAGATGATGINVSRNWIFVNVTATETNEINITFSLYNGTGGATNVTTFTDGTRVINWTGLSEGNYTYNVSIVDGSNQRNTTSTRAITLDRTGPSVTLAKSSSTKTSLTLTVTSSDALSGVNGSCSVSGRANAVVSGGTITETGLVCSTSYTYDVACNDFAGNAGTTSASFSTDSCSGGGGGGGGGGGSGSTTSTWTSTFVPESTAIVEGFTKSLAIKERVRVSVGNTAHHVGVLEVTSTSAKIQVSSTPQEATLSIGESKKFEVTNDSTYDLLVTLVSITAGKAEIIIKAIAEPFSSAPVASPPETGTPTDSKNASATSPLVSNDAESKDSRTTLETRGWVIVIIVLIIVVCVIVFLRRKK